MTNCVFCNLDFNKIENTIIYETENFIVIPSVGSLIDGYVLIVTKKHINSLSELTDEQKDEYEKLVEKTSKLFQKVYGTVPIVFEHGTSNLENAMSASSITHAHSHIVNFNFKNEKEIIKKYNFTKIENFKDVKNENYIYYISNDGTKYVSYNFDSISQLMRLLIAKEIDKEQQYNWREHAFNENIILMLEKFEKYSSLW